MARKKLAVGALKAGRRFLVQFFAFASNVLSVTSSCFVVSARIVPPPARRVNLFGWVKILSVKNVTTK